LTALAGLRPTIVLAVAPIPALLRFAAGEHDPGAGVELAQGGRFSVVQLAQPQVTGPTDRGHGEGLLPFRPNAVLAAMAENRPMAGKQKRRENAIEELLGQIDKVRWFADIFKLQGYDRHVDNPEIHDARDWLAAQFRAIPGVTVTLQEFVFGARTGYNVVAVLPGRLAPDDLYLVGAHYDSRNNILSSTAPAPGAEDNGSGTAAVLEMARVFSRYPPPATLVFVCFSGEEQGLHGSTAHAQSLLDNGTAANLKAALIMDMIGYTQDQTLDLLLESNDTNESLVNACTAAAQTYTSLNILVSFSPFGSDHVPYLNRSMPAVLVIENDWNRYPYYHKANDTTELLGLDMGAEVLKMNVAVLADLMGFGEQSESAAPHQAE